MECMKSRVLYSLRDCIWYRYQKLSKHQCKVPCSLQRATWVPFSAVVDARDQDEMIALGKWWVDVGGWMANDEMLKDG